MRDASEPCNFAFSRLFGPLSKQKRNSGLLLAYIASKTPKFPQLLPSIAFSLNFGKIGRQGAYVFSGDTGR